MEVPELVEALVASIHGSPNPSLTSLSLRILSSRYGNAPDMEHRSNDLLGITQKIIRYLKETPLGYDSNLALQRFDSLRQDFNTHAMLHKKAAILTLLLRLSINSDSTTLYVPQLPNTKPHIRHEGIENENMTKTSQSNTTWHEKHMQQDAFRAALRKQENTGVDIPESVLLQEVLYAFQGIDSKYIYFNQKTERFEVAPHVGVSLPMRNLIRKLTEVGWLYNRVQSFLSRTASDIGGVVTQSFCHALKAELSDFYRLIAILSAQVDIDAEKYPLPDAESLPELTLKRLVVWTQDPLDRLRVMAALVDSVEGLHGGALASGIYMYMEHGDPFVRQFIETILNQVASPILTMIQKWTLEGSLEDGHEEFFVACDNTISDEHLWSQKYSLRWAMLPQFISRDLANTIFVMGKSINFIRTCCGDSEWVMDAQLRTEALTFGHWMEFQQWITHAAKETNGYVTKLLLDKYHLLEHCRAIKQYLLLGQGDFIQYLMDLLQPELSKRASQVYRHNLMNVLETALNSSNAKYENSDILSRLDVKLHQATSGEEGWDVFALHYKLQSPLNTIIPDSIMSEYLRMFSFLFRVKRVEYSLSTCWGRDMNLVHLISKRLPHAWAVMHRGNLLRSKMIHFTTNLHNYMMFEVLETSWHTLVKDLSQATHLDGLIDAHTAYLQRIKSNAFVTDENQPLLRALKGIFETILTFSKIQEAVYTAAVRENQLVARQEEASKTRWGITEETQRFVSPLEATGTLVKQMQSIAQDYHNQFVQFLELLKEQALGSDNLPYLTFRLDFNEYYHRHAHCRSIMTTPVHLLPSGNSWGEDIQIYKSSKAVLPWRPEQQTPVRYVTRYEKSREEREYDLIRAQYRDVKREAVTKDREIKDQMQALVDSKIKQSRYVQKFNLINHYSAEPQQAESALRPPNTRVSYNIVNHNNLAVAPVHVAAHDNNGKKMVEGQHQGRPFSVISNKYHQNHDERSQLEATRSKESAITSFKKTHDFNPLLAQYYDGTKEEKFLVERDADAKIHGVGRDDTLPHGEQFCASKLYNLVNHKVLRPEKFEAITNVGNRRLNCMKSTQVNKAIRERSEALEDRMLEKSLNRISHERNSQTYVHGYDPITTQPFEGRLRKPRVPMRTQPKSHVWARVDGGSNNKQPDRQALPSIERQHSGMHPIEPQVMFISHEQPVDPGGSSITPLPMTKRVSPSTNPGVG